LGEQLFVVGVELFMVGEQLDMLSCSRSMMN